MTNFDNDSYQEECVTDLTIISFDLSADTRESEELEPAYTCLCIVYTDKLLDVFTQELFQSEYMASQLKQPYQRN